MKHENIFSLVGNKVDSQYGDLTGAIQFDCHNNVLDLYTLCKDNNFKTDDYFIIGFGISEFTISGVGDSDNVYCYVLMVSKKKYGNNFEEIRSRIANEKVDVLKKEFSIPYKSLGKYIKRFDAVLLTEMGNHITEMKIEKVI